MVRTSLRVLSIALVASSASSSLALAAWPHNPSTNVPVAVGTGLRQHQVAVADGAGGLYVSWEDFRTGVGRVYAQHLLSDGTVAAGWAASGNPVKTTSSTRTQTVPAICSDAAGGAVIVWSEAVNALDHDIDAQRVSPSGSLLWGASGIGVAATTVDQDAPQVVDDGAGNVDIAWQEDHNGDGTAVDVYANRLGPDGSIRWGVGGVVLCNAVGDQLSLSICSDGASGMDAAWVDHRSNSAIFATHRDSTGALRTGWAANGNGIASGLYAFSPPALVANSLGGFVVVWNDDRNGTNSSDLFATAVSGNGAVGGIAGGGPICTSVTQQARTNVVTDGADGAFVAWNDSRSGNPDVYALRLGPAGAPFAGWPSQGLAVATGSSSQIASSIASDGAGGVILAYTDNASTRTDVYATRLTGSGAIAEGWSAATPVCTAIGDQYFPACASDGAAGAVFVWQDTRNGNSYELFAQNADRWGQLGDARPAIASVKDVLGDQGGRVRVSWNASWLDAGPGDAIGSYWLWREVPAAAALADLRAGRARLLKAGESPDAASGRVLRTSTTAANTYWEYVTSQVANAFPSYSVVAATTTDSSASGNPTTLFMVEARGPGHESWDSAPLPGYSVDNLAPPAPAPFAASYSAGVTQLHWSPPNAPDLASYRLYRGTTSGFSADPAHRIGTADDTTFTDTSGGFDYYRVTAIDLHGNEGPSSLAFPASTTGVGDATGRVLALSGVEPNPVRASARIRWTLPRAESVRVTLVDLAGRHVRTIVDGVQPAGINDARWDARDDAGRAVSGGIYFVRLEAEGRVLHARAAVIR